MRAFQLILNTVPTLFLCCNRSVVSIGSYAFASCSRLNVVIVSPTTIEISSNAFYGDRALTGIDATIPVCEKVLKSCNGTCTQILGCFTPSSAPTRIPSTIQPTRVPSGSPVSASSEESSAAGLSVGIIAAIVIGATLAIALVIALLYWWNYRKGYGAVKPIEVSAPPVVAEGGATTPHRANQVSSPTSGADVAV